MVSFDDDFKSVACTGTLKQNFFPADKSWSIEKGSALDRDYLRGLGSFDVVYAWGVLHHTGAMWTALENMVSLVKESGKLFLAVYNDQGKLSSFWRLIKRAYNRTHPRLRFVVLWSLGVVLLAASTAKDIFCFRRPRIISKAYRPRGMSPWSDVVDWVGGYPFEVASREEIIGFYEARGFALDRLV